MCDIAYMSHGWGGRPVSSSLARTRSSSGAESCKGGGQDFPPEGLVQLPEWVHWDNPRRGQPQIVNFTINKLVTSNVSKSEVNTATRSQSKSPPGSALAVLGGK